MQRQILHIDVNNAFLSWTAVERLKNGETLDIRTIPAIIGGDEEKRKGVVLAKSNIAKQFGIQTGEPIYFARKKCPKIQIFASNYSIYIKYSQAMHQIFSEYTPKIEQFSIDECFLDLTEYLPKGKTLLQIAYEINKRIYNELNFTVNVGVAHNKLLAKMASDFEKPNKVHTLWEEEIPEKMWKLPVGELFMVGRKSLPKLQKMGIKTIGDLANKQEQELIRYFGKYGKLIWEYANGIDLSEVKYEKENPKCIGNSITLPQDCEDIEKLEEILLMLVEQVTYRLRKQNLKAKVVNVQIKTNEFKVFSHQRKMEKYTDVTKYIYQEAKKLLKDLKINKPIRLIGIRVDDLSNEENSQISLFDIQTKENKKQEKIDKTLDKIKEKYGYNAIKRGGEININGIIDLNKLEK